MCIGTDNNGQGNFGSKGVSTPPRSHYIVLNTLWMQQENLGFPPFLLSFEIFNYNVHNCLVASSTTTNVMPLSIAKQINAQCSETFTRIIKRDRTLVLVIGEL